MADYLKMAPEQFLTEYTEKHEGHTVLKNFPDGACIFLTESGCRVHPAKPVQCREFPARWREADAYDYCEGILRLRNQPANA